MINLRWSPPLPGSDSSRHFPHGRSFPPGLDDKILPLLISWFSVALMMTLRCVTMTFRGSMMILRCFRDDSPLLFVMFHCS